MLPIIIFKGQEPKIIGYYNDRCRFELIALLASMSRHEVTALLVYHNSHKSP